jgi:hypothetical protein
MQIAKPGSSYDVDQDHDQSEHQRMLFPWFVGIIKGDEYLEDSEVGIWSQLSVAYWDLLPVNLTVTFGGTWHLDLNSPILAALVGKIRWDSPDALVSAHV